ncbi:hypothetical protein HYS85_00220 [Candidatus Saccharibacteria bacterium]|nr:hypothetical protein [Candidatus Saccharibacteria bacterium]
MNYGSTRIQTLNQGAAQTLILGRTCVLTAIRAYSNNSQAQYLNVHGYVQVFDAAAGADITVGTTSPNWIVPVVSSNVSDGDGLPTMGVMMRSGVVIACTSTPAGATSANLNVEICIV